MLRTASLISFIVFLGLVTYVLTDSQTDSCELRTGIRGQCELLKDCDSAIKGLNEKPKIYPKSCQKPNPDVVCCDQDNRSRQLKTQTQDNRQPGTISKLMCANYSQYVYELKPSPVLLINSPPPSKTYECGHQVVELIVGGERAGRKEFPHMTAIGYEENHGGIHWSCGGSIISHNYVLTAAHCLWSEQYGDAKFVRVGIVDLDHKKKRQNFRIIQHIPFPGYSKNSHYDDIALVKLDKSIRFNSYARPACLYTSSEVKGTKAIATGWGDVSDAGHVSSKLSKVTLDLFSFDYCKKIPFKSKRLQNGVMEKTQMCAGSYDAVKDTCYGDSGGPLQIYHIGDDIKCMYDIIGVTSFGKHCNGEFGVYTKVSNYIKWIEDIVWPKE